MTEPRQSEPARFIAADPRWVERAAVVFVPLGVLSVALLLPWTLSGATGVADVLSPMLGAWTLPALGLLVVAACGGLDLSVWAAFTLGAAAAGAATDWALRPVTLMAAGAAAGLAVGAVNAAAVAFARAPAWAASLISATAAASAATALTGRWPGSAAEADWLVDWAGNRRIMLLVLAFYAMVVLLAAALRRGWRDPPARPGWVQPAALLASGVLSAVGGVCHLMKSAEVPTGRWIIGDLRPAAAVLLTGALFLRGRGRMVAAAVFLPPAMLLATVWKYQVWDIPGCPVAANLLALMVMVGGIQGAAHLHLRAAWPRPWRGRLDAGALAAIGLGLVAATGGMARPWREVFGWSGAALWAVGVGVWVFGRGRRRAAP